MPRTFAALAVLALVVTVAAMGVMYFNRSLQQEVAERQQAINQGLALSQLNMRLVNTLAGLAAQNKDEQLKTLLALHGITVSLNPAAQAPLAAPTAQRPIAK